VNVSILGKEKVIEGKTGEYGACSSVGIYFPAKN
jgi:hypothetical protein